MDKKVIKISKVIIILIPFFILGGVLNKHFTPLGELTVKYDFKKESPFISDLYPSNRVGEIDKENGYYYRSLKDDTVYFDLTLPRWFNEAIFEIKFKSQNPIFEIRGRESKEQWAFTKKPLENKIIDKEVETGNWHEIRDGDLLLMQRRQEFDGLTQFFANFPATRNIATYSHDDLPRDFKLTDYVKANKITTIKPTLRGRHIIYTYIKDEDLDFKFAVTDINRKFGPDRININVYQQETGEKIHSQSLEDDGETGPTDKIVAANREITIDLPDLPEGVYKVELDFSDDLITEKIESKQNKLVFGQRLFIANSNEYFPELSSAATTTDIYSSGERLVISTTHPAGLQTIKTNDNSFDIAEINERYVLGKEELGTEEISTIHSPQSDLLIESGGYFAYSRDNFFYPEPSNIKKLDAATEMRDLTNTEFIIANYSPPISVKDDWEMAQVKFDLTKLYMDEDMKIQFLFTSPGLQENAREIQVEEIKVTLKKPPLTWDNFLTRLKNFVNQARNQ